MQKVKVEYNKYLAFEESYRQQKAWYECFENRDKNTRRFHRMLKGRKHKLKVKSIQDSQGCCWKKKEKKPKMQYLSTGIVQQDGL